MVMCNFRRNINHIMSTRGSSELHAAFYNKAVEIALISKRISYYLNVDLCALKPNGHEDINIYFSGDIVRQSSSLAPHIKMINQEIFSEKRQHYAKIVKWLMRGLVKNCNRLENCNSNGNEFISILRKELRRLKKIQKNWLLTI